MDCKDFQNQFEVDSDLKMEAKKHLKECKNCQAFESEEKQLTQMMKGLPKVEAPKDFGFRLNASIARTEQIKRPLPKIWQTLRYALPLTAAVLIFGFVIVNSSLFDSQNQELAKATNVNQFELKEDSKIESTKDNFDQSETLIVENIEKNVATDDSDQPLTSLAKEEKIEPTPEFVKPVARREIKTQEAKNISNPSRRNDRPIENEDFSGSRNMASTQPEVITPQNTNQNNFVKKLQPQAKSTRLIDRLSDIGVSATQRVWKVQSVRKGSVAEKSGVSIGDILIEVNGESITEKQDKLTKIKTLRLLRNGKILNISLVN